MDPNEILTRILRRYGTLTDQIRATQIIESKISKKIATYADADQMALRIGQALTKALKENLPDALTDGMLYRAIAEVVVERPLKVAGADVARFAEEIQQGLNDAAGIGIQPIVPEMNQDQIDGIITGICNEESFDAGADTLFSRLENCLEGYVDDFVRENADFQYRAGLSPKIERRAVGKCCAWCSRLAGTYEYSDVSDRGNEVFRRHKNCHCIVNYVPANGAKRRQNVHSKRWTDDGRDDRIAMAEEQSSFFEHKRLYRSDLKNGLPIKGDVGSISDMLDESGRVIQRRIYGKDGMAAVDFDLTDHGESWKYPEGAHKHVFEYSGKKPKRLAAEMTQEDLDINSDIIIEGVNYHGQK